MNLSELMLVALWLSVTLIAYRVSLYFYTKANGNPLIHPLVVTTLLVGGVLIAFNVPVPEYQQHANLLYVLLGPVTVALAVPLYRQLHQIRDNHRRILLPVIIGGSIAPLSCVLILYAMDADPMVILSSWTKSITTPLATETTFVLGGEAGLAAIVVIITGVFGAIIADPLFRLTGISDDASKGVALGTAAHAVGTAHAFQVSEKSGAFSSLALCINGILTAIVLPILFRVFG